MTAELIPLTLATETLALVPAQALSWHQVQLPPGTLNQGLLKDRAAPRLRAVLEGLLEDRLLDEPAQLHFALQPNARAGAAVWVAVCDRAWLRDALATLTKSGRMPQRLVPEWAPDAPAEQLWVTGREDAPQAVWIDADGVHRIPLPQGSEAVSASWQKAKESYALWAEPAVAAVAEQRLGRSPRVQGGAERLRQSAVSAWDLAQFDVRLNHSWWERLQQAAQSFLKADAWRPARWALAGLALVQLVGLNAYAWRVNGQTQGLRAQSNAMLLETFPQTKAVVDAPVQMQRELDKLRQSRGGGSAKDLEAMLAAVGSANALAGSAPAGIEYTNGELRLTGLRAEQGPTLDAALRANGLSAQAEGSAVVVRARGTP